MSPKLSALEEEEVVGKMATENLEEKFESSASVFEIGTADGGSDKSGEAVGEDVFSTPAPGKKKLVSAKAANDKATASSSSSVDRPLEQEATEGPTMTQRTVEEQQERLQENRKSCLNSESSKLSLRKMKQKRSDSGRTLRKTRRSCEQTLNKRK